MKKKKKKNCSAACRAARECFVQVLEGLRLNESPWTSGGYADIVAVGGRALQRGQSPGMASGRGVIAGLRPRCLSSASYFLFFFFFGWPEKLTTQFRREIKNKLVNPTTC